MGPLVISHAQTTGKGPIETITYTSTLYKAGN